MKLSPIIAEEVFIQILTVLISLVFIISQDDAGTLTAFFNPSRAIAKTVMQTVGELDFETIFNDGDLLFSPSAYLLFFTFVVVMPVLFSNLLVYTVLEEHSIFHLSLHIFSRMLYIQQCSIVFIVKVMLCN